MAIISYRPFFDLDRFFEDEDWFLPVIPKGKISPEMDLYETDKEVVAEINAPGIDPEKTEIIIDKDTLKIKGEREEKKEEKKRDYWRKEIIHQAFERIVKIPVPINEDKVEATYEKGVLKITMPKKEAVEQKGKKVKIVNK